VAVPEPRVGRFRRLGRYLRENFPILALLLLAPTIPELLTGSTPVTTLVYDPFQFLISFGLDIGLYGTGALLIREFAVVYRKGWASILLLGAAYGIAEEGFAVHTFFQASGSPVNALGSYGHAFGVNWLWALGLTIFHATYSIALPILLVQLWYPATRSERWLRRPRSLALVAFVYFGEVVLFARLVGHGPSPAALGFFLGLVAVLLALAYRMPADALAVRPGRTRLGRLGLVLAGTLSFSGWVVVLFLSATSWVPAVGAAVVVAVTNGGALAVIVRRVGIDDVEWAKYWFATGMLAILFVWDVPVEFSVPGILAVTAIVAYLQYRLAGRIRSRSTEPSPPTGALAAPPG
jgi:hypothetical protein